LAAHDTTPTTFIVVLAKETVNDGSGCGTWWCFSGFWRYVDSSVDASVSGEINCLFSALKKETVCFSETFISTDERARLRNPEEHRYHPCSCENLRSYITFFFFCLKFPLNQARTKLPSCRG
jgi:hypothetical protein